ncbi:glycoside hydrolase [uncultured Bacteroides sp.]|uniref:glycoside hydrolase n=1 Tax=uncultured Bacteroides sp. TaxID=162156 RepID=UPI002AAC106D|nr:glycoside hydrolase [uncultured Bacteroides sp.]
MKNIKAKFILTVIALGLITLSICAQTTITNTPQTKYQTIKGWGVSLCWWANLVGGMPQASINDIANRIAVQMNYNFFRFNIGGGDNPSCQWGNHMRKDGGNMPGYRSYYPDGQGWGVVNVNNDVRQISVMNKLANLRSTYGDIITEMFSNSPPYFMTKTYCSAGEWNGGENLNPGFEDDFADYLCSVTKTLRTAHSNWNIKYIEPFNEPYSNWWKAGGNQDGCEILHNTQATILWNLWRSQQTYGISDIGLIASDCNTVAETRTNMHDLWANHINEYNGLSVLATHTYGGSWSEKAALFSDGFNTGKNVWQTETGPLGWVLPSGGQWWWRHYDMAYRMIEDMRNLKCEVWCDWQAMSYDDGWGLFQQTNWNENNPYQAATLKNTRSFYIRKQIANYAKVGYTQIDNNCGNSMSFLKSDNKEVVVVIVNNSTNSNSYIVDLTKFQTISGFKTYRTSGGDSSKENATEKTTPSKTEKGLLSANKITYTAPAWSVTTFVVKVPGLLGASKVINSLPIFRVML